MSQSFNPRNQKPPKLRHACNDCHASKVRCSGERTGCQRCLENRQTCTYSVSMVGKVQSHRRRKKLKEIATSQALSSNIQAANIESATTPSSCIISNKEREDCNPEVNRNTGATIEHAIHNTEAVGSVEKDGQEDLADFQMDFTNDIPGDFMSFVDFEYMGPNLEADINDEPWYRTSRLDDPSSNYKNPTSVSPGYTENCGRPSGKRGSNTPSQPSPSQPSPCQPSPMEDSPPSQPFPAEQSPLEQRTPPQSSPQFSPSQPSPPQPSPHLPSPSETLRCSPEHQHHPRNSSQSLPTPRPLDIYPGRNYNRGEDDYKELSNSMESDFNRDIMPFPTPAPNHKQFQRRNTLQNTRGAMTPRDVESPPDVRTPLSMHSRVSSVSSALPSLDSYHSMSKCLVVISKLQKLLRDPSSASLDVILAINKSALLELENSLSAPASTISTAPGTSRSLSPDDYFGNSLAYRSSRTELSDGSSSLSSSTGTSVPADPATLMIYVVALKHIHELYSKACFIFIQETNRSQHNSSLSSSNSSISHPHDASPSSVLPKLDFGSFKIDLADQRRLFSEIIARELAKCLGVCGKVRGCFINQPGDISAPTGLLEETFLGIEKGMRKLYEGIRV